ncbi:tyrosine-type recombinase/integrase [Marinobacterium sp. AK62]|uniref:Tyrosine-type recombinase/integrase n=1 Tax=Marinobacterium alkalitolerans TaxID=1542925 RepID=A0ABS3ZC40_9GAMM|nr:site-specific integrase [Marinobacterium alkalitolerans]MBP0049186.1 tyrosine-type recombinase/integrase [Marinobacterium alkalitolerans]
MPIPLFDAPDFLELGNDTVTSYLTRVTLHQVTDAALVYEYACAWLLEHRNNSNNYKTYRSELTTYLYWCFEIQKVSPLEVKRRELFQYIAFCESPPEELIGYFNTPQFREDRHSGERLPNPNWKPFLGKKEGGQVLAYQISDTALKTKLSVLSAFYSYLIDEELTERNPARQVLRSGSLRSSMTAAREQEGFEPVKAFSELQWSYVMSTARARAEASGEHERTLFLVSLMYACYLRISEVAARPGFSPVMGQFRRDSRTGIWSYLVPRSKGGKSRTVAVSKALLGALKRYRKHLGLSLLPSPGEETPLFVRQRAGTRGRSAGMVNANLGIRQIRDLIDELIQAAADEAMADGFGEDAAEMRNMTAHSIRHTGITHDINLNGRPLSHVQADAGHDSIDTTSRYLHTSQIERHESATGKKLDRLMVSGEDL